MTGVPTFVQILPAGTFTPTDGRGPWTLRDPAAVIAASFAGRDRIPVDYDHQLERAHAAGHRGTAPAAGWIDRIDARADGLWASITWTARAAAAIAGKEYRFVSPVIVHTPDGVVQQIRSVALVNVPALPMLMALCSAQLRPHGEVRAAPAFDLVDSQLVGARAEPADVAVNAAIAAGKVPETGRAWALSFAARDRAGFDRYIGAAPALNAARSIPAQGAPPGVAPVAPPAMTEEDRKIAWLVGMSPEALAAAVEVEKRAAATPAAAGASEEAEQRIAWLTGTT